MKLLLPINRKFNGAANHNTALDSAMTAIVWRNIFALGNIPQAAKEQSATSWASTVAYCMTNDFRGEK